MSDGTTKVCSQCKEPKPLDRFGRSARAGDGLRSQCLTCNAARARRDYTLAGPPGTITCERCGAEHETRNPRTRYCSGRCKDRAADERRSLRAAERATARKCHKCGTPTDTRVGRPVCAGCRVDKRRRPHVERRRTLRKYGLTEADWDRMLADQGGACAVCRTDRPGSRGERWHIDHSHATDRVRGLLCHQCNVGIGNMRDSPALLRAAAAYLEASASP